MPRTKQPTKLATYMVTYFLDPGKGLEALEDVAVLTFIAKHDLSDREQQERAQAAVRLDYIQTAGLKTFKQNFPTEEDWQGFASHLLERQIFRVSTLPIYTETQMAKVMK